MKKTLCQLSATLVLTIALCGCATRYLVSIDSIRDEAVFSSNKRYFIFPAIPGVPPSDLHFREYASYLRNVLTRNHFYETSPDSADIAVFVIYGIGDPQLHAYSFSVPIYGRTDPGAATVSSSTLGPGGFATSTGTITYRPRFGIVGTQSYSGTYATYFRYLILGAIDLHAYRKDSSLALIWQSTITSEGSSNDLRAVIPVMIAASGNYITTNTGKRIDVDIRENDPRIYQLRFPLRKN